jgi:hypothetical protein
MATRGQQKRTKRLEDFKKEAKIRAARRQAIIEGKKVSNATKTKAELTRLEKEAEKKSAERQARNKALSKTEMAKRTPPKSGTRRALRAERKALTGSTEGIRTDKRTTTAKKVAQTASRVGRLARGMTGVGAALQAEKLGGGRDTMKGMESRRNEFVNRETQRQTKNYNVGVSKGGVSFREAFRHFRNKGAKTFTWNGKKYTTELKK